MLIKGFPKEKPRQWGPVEAVKNRVLDYFNLELEVPAPSLLFPFWEGLGNLFPNYGTLHIASITGNPQWMLGGGARTDNNEYILTPFNLSFLSNKYTLISAIKPVQLSSTIRKFFVGQYQYDGSGYNFGFYINASPYSINFYGAPGEATTSSSNLSVGSLSRLAVTHTGKLISFYFNGEPEGTPKSTTSGLGSTYALTFGRTWETAWSYCDVIHDYFAAFSTPLTADQISLVNDNPYAAIQPRSVPVYFFPSAGGGAYTLAADSGSYSVAGSDSLLLKNSIVDAGIGGYSVTGTPSDLFLNRSVYAGLGSYSVAGSDTSLLKNSLVSAGAGSYSVTGSEISLLLNRVLSVGTESFSITGADVDLVYSGTIGPTYTLSATSGSFTIAGTDVGLLLNRVLAAGSGEYSISGQAVALLFNRIISALTGSHEIIGTDVDLIYSGDVPPTYTLCASSGGFSITGTVADLLLNRILAAGGGSVSISGSDAALLLGRVMSSGGGAFSVTGSDSDLLKNSILYAGSGSYSIDGKAVTLTWSGVVLPTGLLSITFTASAPTVSFSGKAPTTTFN